WYPVKDAAEVRRFHRMIADLALPKCQTIEATWRAVDGERLSGAGLVTVNAPFPWRRLAVRQPACCGTR
ncbi:23S rRNA (adenine(2030)-N(6))-methyltransferase RlmJ, partial [Acinetobacter baumannii]|uniref:23S rRNA (adenine(2030)-N(6))-methyltransferase RlmJ n=1 Tax=Acinetobacter baumannii TaxID=470 RepID=UPI0013D0C08C